MNDASGLLQTGQDALWLHFIVLLRMGPVVALFPGLGESTVPARVKLVLALGLSAVIAPVLAPQLADVVADQPPLAWLVLSETGTGLLIGIGLRLLLMALQTAGSVAAQSTSLAQILGNASVTPLPAVGHLLVNGGLALAMLLGLHLRMVEMLVLTYDLFPVATLPDAGAVRLWGTRQVAAAFALAFTLAAPFVILSVLYNLTLGVVNRAMPQLMVVFIGAPAITAAGLFMLFLLAPTMLALWAQALDRFIANPFGGG